MLFSARSLCALKTGCGERREGEGEVRGHSPILGSERATGSGIDQVENLCLVGAISNARPDLSHLPDFFCCLERAEQQDATRVLGGGGGGGESDGEGERELILPHIANVNPLSAQAGARVRRVI